MPGAVLELSTPAAASTRPCLVSAILVGPRRATTRTASASIARSRSARITRPSALLMIFDVTTTMSPSRRSGAASLISRARSAPGAISGSPGTPVTVSSAHRVFAASSAARDRAARAISADAARSVM